MPPSKSPAINERRRQTGERLRVAREAVGLSGHELARRSGHHRDEPGQFERGLRTLTRRSAVRFAAVLGLTASDLTDV